MSLDLKTSLKGLGLSKEARQVNLDKRRESYRVEEAADDVVNLGKELIDGSVIDSLRTVVVKGLTVVARDTIKGFHTVIAKLAKLRLFIIVVKASA